MNGATLLIERFPGETRAALLRGKDVWQVDHFRDGEPATLGGVYLGRVRRLDPAMNAAFVDIGVGADGFLRARDAAKSKKAGQEKAGRRARIAALAPLEGELAKTRERLDAQERRAETAEAKLAETSEKADELAHRVATMNANEGRTGAELASLADKLTKREQDLEAHKEAKADAKRLALDVARAEEAGYLLLAKPMDPNMLRVLLKRWLRGRAAEPQVASY